MKKAKKILITTVTHEVVIMRRCRMSTIRAFCPPCGAETQMLELNEAGAFYGAGERELIRQIENNALHSIEGSNGRLFICEVSLRRAATRKGRNDA